MAGTVDIVMRHYAGIDTSDQIMSFNPNLPEDIHGLRLRVQYRGIWYRIDINDKRFKLSVERGREGPISVKVMGKTIEIEPGMCQTFSLHQKANKVEQ